VTDEDRNVLAAEYVLGLASPEERARVERDLDRDFELRRAVYYWQDRLFPMTRLPDPSDPSPALWPRIEKSLEPPAEAPRGGWWESLALWRGLSVTALALAVALGARFLAPTVAPERYPAVLQNDQKTAGWIVEIEARGNVRLVPLAATPVPPQRALEFWTKAPSATAPTSLGLVPGDRTTEIPAARLPSLEPDTLFELTLEPETGSPIGRPTGPILFVGRAVALK
jgi:anti-sigma-K factor RskA